MGPVREAGRRLDQPPVLLDLSGDHGGVHGHAVRVHLDASLRPARCRTCPLRWSRWCSRSSPVTSPIRGITGSTMTSIVILVIQIVSLIGISMLFIAYRIGHPHARATRVANAAARSIIPHSFIDMLYQSTIAILLLVGFESITALGAEAIRPEKDIKRGVLISLLIQGGFCYLFAVLRGELRGRQGDPHALERSTGQERRARVRGGRGRLRADRHDAEDDRRSVARPTARDVGDRRRHGAASR